MNTIRYSILSEETNKSRIIKVDSHSSEMLDTARLAKRLCDKDSSKDFVEMVKLIGDLSDELKISIGKGEDITLPFFSSSYKITGKFKSAEDLFDPERHKLKLCLTPGEILKEGLKDLLPNKIDAVSKIISVDAVIDSTTRIRNKQITPNGAIEIYGKRLKIMGEDSKVGVFFVNASTGEEYKATSLGYNKPSLLVAVVPKLSKGSWYVVVRNQYSEKGVIKRINSGISDFVLKV